MIIIKQNSREKVNMFDNSPLLFLCIILLFCIPKLALSKTYYYSCYIFGEEKISDDFYIINTSSKSFLHKAGRNYYDILEYNLYYDIIKMNNKSVIASKRLFSHDTNNKYQLGLPMELLAFVDGDFKYIQRKIGRFLTDTEKNEIKQISNTLKKIHISVFVDFFRDEYQLYIPEIKFNLSKESKFYQFLLKAEHDSILQKGKCKLL
ncbi:hypothetical protein OAJ21_02040 [Pelagibacteraceae bacterium]|nr:hypothetical protein [Pelagibacteraceae bacterium]